MTASGRTETVATTRPLLDGLRSADGERRQNPAFSQLYSVASLAIALAAALLLVVAVRPDFPGTIRVAAAGIALLAVLTHHPIHQKFILVDPHATVLMRASAD